MAALNSTVASVLVREYVFSLTDENTRTERRGEGGGEPDSKALGAYGRDVLNDLTVITAGFRRRQRARFPEHLFCTPKVACPISSKAPTAARDNHAWIIS